MQKAPLTAAIIAALSLTGCNISSTSDNSEVDTLAVESGLPEYEGPVTVTPVFAPSVAKLPLGTDFLFAEAADFDGTAKLDETDPTVTAGYNDLDGMSTIAPIDIPLTGALDATSVAAGATVFLLEMYNSDTVDALDIASIAAENPAIAAATQPTPETDYTARYLELTSGTETVPTIRIDLKTPLKPKTKYIVALAGSINDSSGNEIGRSTEYALLLGTDPLVNPALQPARDAVQAWDAVAAGVLASIGVTGETKITFAYTTTDPTAVVKTTVAPEVFLAPQLQAALAASTDGATLATLEAIYKAGVTDAVYLQMLQAVGSALETPIVPTDTTGADAQAVKATTEFTTAFIFDGAAGGAIPPVTTIVMGSLRGLGSPDANNDGLLDTYDADGDGQNDFTDILPPIDPPINNDGAMLGVSFERDIDIDATKSIPSSVFDAANGATGALSNGSTIHFGTVRIPTYLTSNGDMVASTSVGASLDGALGNDPGTTPPLDSDGSTNVTYRYPFAQLQGYEQVQVLVTTPDDTACGETWDTAVFIHGITSNRTASLLVGNAMAAAPTCVATVAIDLPLHGIPAQTIDRNGARVTNTLLDLPITPSGTIRSEIEASAAFAGRHGSIALTDAQEPTAIVYTSGSEFGTSGDLYINLTNFRVASDNQEQGIIDNINLLASLDGSDLDGDGDVDVDFGTTSNSFVIGHSLGAIIATNVAAITNDSDVQKWRGLAASGTLPQVEKLAIANGGAGVVKILENSQSFKGKILAGLSASGLEQGSTSLAGYFSILQATLDSGDAGNYASSLTDTPILAFEVTGGGAIDSTIQATVSLPDAVAAGGLYPSDLTVPNQTSAATDEFGADRPPSALNYISGSTQLNAYLGLEQFGASTLGAVTDSDTANGFQGVIRYKKGTHSTFAAGDDQDVFTEMMTNLGAFFLTTGTTLSNADDVLAD